jgi:hypothetical protein
MQQTFLEARGTVGVDAAARRCTLGADNVAVTDRALRWHPERMAVFALFEYADYFGDHVAGAFDENDVADLNAQAFDLIFVVQSGSRDSNTTDADRLQDSGRRDSTGASHVHLNAIDASLLLTRGEFESDGPARGFRCPSQAVLLFDGIDLGDHAVNLKGQRVALLLPVFAKGDEFLYVGANGVAFIYFQTSVLEFGEHFGMAA